MIKYNEDADTVCPFYSKDATTRMVCEGITEGCSTITCFENKVLKARYQNNYCRKNYHSCRLCKALMTKYD